METDVGGADDDAQGQSEHAVLWEKCIQQSIFVDLSEDESLNLSDLEGSLILHVSQAESASVPSIHLSAEQADLSDVTSSQSSINSQQSDGVVEDKRCTLQPCPQRPNRTQRFDNSGQNTSDEEQEELPYDGDLGSNYCKSVISRRSSGRKETINETPDGPALFEPKTGNKDDAAGSSTPVEQRPENKAASATADTRMRQENLFPASKQSDLSPPFPCPADIHQLLLRHFPQEELLQPDRLIQAETLPEVSLLESVDDAGCSLLSAHDGESIDGDHSGSIAPDTEAPESEEKLSGSEGNGHDKTDVASSAADSNTLSSEGSGNSSVVAVSKQEQAGEDQQIPRVPLARVKSFSDMKYGQGQVHYPLPDFSKISPKVKIPKAASGPARPAPQSVGAMHRTRSSPEILEVISRVLEDSGQTSESPHVLAEADRTLPNPAHQRQAKPSAEVMHDEGVDGDHQGMATAVEGRHLESLVPCPLSGEQSPQSHVTVKTSTSCRQPEEAASDGEQMTAELRDIVCQFMEKVEEFKKSVRLMSVGTAEQQAMLRSIMDAQDQLERRYISKKEEHRALEMQNYRGLSRNTGTFDPSRRVEGDIFRIGMHLEDIKEMIDKNAHEQILPPRSSSTPTSVTNMLDMKPLCTSTPLPPPSLREASLTDISTPHFKTETREEGRNEITKEVNKYVSLQTRQELITSDPSLRDSQCSSSTSRCLQASYQELDIAAAEADEETSSALSEALDHSNILEYLSRAKLSSRQSQRTPESCGSPDAVLNVCDAAAKSSPSPDVAIRRLPEPPVNTSSFTSQIVRAETDSGFGSSYLNQTGLFQPNLLAGRVQQQNDALSNSDSEGSCSNIQTVQAVTTSRQGWDSPPQTGVAVGVEQWVENTRNVSSLRPQEQTKVKRRLLYQLKHHVSDSVLNTTMAAVGSSSPLQSCSCNSEAILALQSEVTRLREELQQCLVQLPHLAQEIDYLSFTREYRSNTRTRSHHRPTSNRPRRDRNSLSSSQVTVGDRISTDMDQQYTGTKRVDSTDSDAMLQCAKMSVGGRTMPESRECPKTSNLKSKQMVPNNIAKHGPLTSVMESFHSKVRWPFFSSACLEKPFLQVSYGSSCSLPASYKVREPSALQSTAHHRKHSTQSDSALLPSDVYFQRTPSPVSVASKTGRKAGRCRLSKEDDIVTSLDMAIALARSMKQTTEKMAKRLSADLSKSHLHRKPPNL